MVAIRRRRQCVSCEARFTTFERAVARIDGGEAEQ